VAELIIRTADGQRQTRPLTGQPLVIGRDPDCHLSLTDDPYLSFRHARVYCDARGQYAIEDLRSKNGTVLNGQNLIGSALLSDGDLIRIGSHELLFREHAAVQPTRLQPKVVLTPEETRTGTTTTISSAQQALALSKHRLELLSELGLRITSLLDRDALLNQVMDICLETLHFDRGLIALRPAKGETLDMPVVRNVRSDEAGTLTISRSLIAQAMNEGKRSIVVDAADDQIDPTQSMAIYHIRSAACVPIEFRGEVLGVVYLDRVTDQTRKYTAEDLDFLAAIARQLAVGLANIRLIEASDRRRRMEQDLHTARAIQLGLLPRAALVRSNIVVEGLNEPGAGVSGDYYDFLELPDGRVAVIVADVVGKGIPAGLLMASLQGAVRTTLAQSGTLAEAMAAWNLLTCTNSEESRYITAAAAIVDPASQTVEYSLAGHEPPYWLVPSRPPMRLQSPGGFPLGIDPVAEYPVFTHRMDPRPGTLLFFTDGVTEAMNERMEDFGRERLEQMLALHSGLPPGELLLTCRQGIRDFVGPAAQSDDITLIAVHLPA
jgi:sigma-B regulation protein RsbU (phosphoserine phosphatase)